MKRIIGLLSLVTVMILSNIEGSHAANHNTNTIEVRAGLSITAFTGLELFRRYVPAVGDYVYLQDYTWDGSINQTCYPWDPYTPILYQNSLFWTSRITRITGLNDYGYCGTPYVSVYTKDDHGVRYDNIWPKAYITFSFR